MFSCFIKELKILISLVNYINLIEVTCDKKDTLFFFMLHAHMCHSFSKYAGNVEVDILKFC